MNPVLREGNSDRRAATSVKQFAQKNPHKMGAWDPACKSHVAHMTAGDFYGNEKSAIIPSDCTARIQLTTKDGAVKVLKELPLIAGEVCSVSLW